MEAEAPSMIWKAVRHMVVTEILTWAVFLLVAAVFGAVAMHFFSSGTISVIVVVLWFSLFLWIYRKRYGHL
jgi:hypothetical protein